MFIMLSSTEKHSSEVWRQLAGKVRCIQLSHAGGDWFLFQSQ